MRNYPETKGERRDEKCRKKKRMKVNGAGLRDTSRTLLRKAREAEKDGQSKVDGEGDYHHV